MIHNKFANGRLSLLAALTLLAAACGQADGDTDEAGPVAAGTDAVVAVSASAQDAGAEPGEAGSGEGLWGDLVYGSADAPVEIIEYASLTCPHCATFAATVFPQLESDYIATGKVRFIFRNFVMNRYDLAASTAMRCSTMDVGKQLLKSYFARQDEWMRSEDPMGALAGIARRAGISRTQFDRCVSNTDMHQHLVDMTQRGQEEFDITGTPTLIVDGKTLNDDRELIDVVDGKL